LIPSPKADYYKRKEYWDIMEKFYKVRQSLFLWGEAGVGKTMLVEQFAAEKGVAYLEISLDVGFSPKEVFGGWMLRDGKTIWKEGLFVILTQVPSVILLDEITATDPAMMFQFHQLLASKKLFVREAFGTGKEYKVHPDCWIVFAGNPPTAKYVGTTKLNWAFLSRLYAVEVLPPSKDEFEKILNLDKKIFGKLYDYYEKFREGIKTNNLRTSFSLREMKKIKILLDSGMDLETAINYAFINVVESQDIEAAKFFRGILELK